MNEEPSRTRWRTTADGSGRGTLILHPATVVSGLVLLINDIWLKHAWPSVWTGKLSDFAGLVVLPVTIQALTEILGLDSAARRLPRSWARGITLFVGSGFVLVKLVPAVHWAYRWSVGVLRWPGHAVAALLQGGYVPGVQPILVSRDPSDLVALAILPVAYYLILRKYESSSIGCGVSSSRY